MEDEESWLDVRAFARDYADFLGPLLKDSPIWVFRRVEAVRFIDDESMRLQVSTDFDLSATSMGREYLAFLRDGFLPAPLLPIGLLAKRPLEDFDLRDWDGKAITLLTQRVYRSNSF